MIAMRPPRRSLIGRLTRPSPRPWMDLALGVMWLYMFPVIVFEGLPIYVREGRVDMIIWVSAGALIALLSGTLRLLAYRRSVRTPRTR